MQFEIDNLKKIITDFEMHNRLSQIDHYKYYKKEK